MLSFKSYISEGKMCPVCAQTPCNCTHVSEDAEQIDELSKETLKSYVDKVSTGPSRGKSPNGILKSIKAIGGVTKAIKKQYLGSNVKENTEQAVDRKLSFGEYSEMYDQENNKQ